MSLVARAELLALARTLVARHTRWKHQGRRPETGLDCAGVLIWLAHELGLFDCTVRVYRRQADGVTLEAACREQFDVRPGGLAEARPGDVLSFRASSRYPCHLALVGDGATPFSLIHATPLLRRVFEQSPDPWLMPSLSQVYTWRVAYPSGRGVSPWPS